MAKCTAQINGHRTASGRANCPVCGQRGYNSYLQVIKAKVVVVVENKLK